MKHTITNLKLSRFAKIFEKEEVCCVIHSLTLRKIYGGEMLKTVYDGFAGRRNVENVLRELGDQYPTYLVEDILTDMCNRGLLVEREEDDVKVYERLFHQGRNLYTVRHMYFLPTSACNFRCKYCFVEDEARKLCQLRMGNDTAKKTIDIFAKLSEEATTASITFYGGEPLLNADVVYSTMRYVRHLERQGLFKKPVRMSLITNGSCVDERTVAELAETNTKVSVSIDGPEWLHNAVRVDHKGDATFAAAVAGYYRLQKAGLKPGVSCTLSEANVERIDEVVDFIVNELCPTGMGFNILLPSIGKQNLSKYSFQFATVQLIRAFERLREHGVYEDRMMRRVRPYINGGFHLKDCMGVGGQIVVTPDGRIGPCQACLGLDRYFPISVDELYARLPDINSDDIYADPLFDEWRHRFPLNMKDCMDCPAIGICGGGCPYAAFVSSGSIWARDERICAQAKTILEWMLWDTYKNMRTSEVDRSRGEAQYSI